MIPHPRQEACHLLDHYAGVHPLCLLPSPRELAQYHVQDLYPILFTCDCEQYRILLVVSPWDTALMGHIAVVVRG